MTLANFLLGDRGGEDADCSTNNAEDDFFPTTTPLLAQFERIFSLPALLTSSPAELAISSASVHTAEKILATRAESTTEGLVHRALTNPSQNGGCPLELLVLLLCWNYGKLSLSKPIGEDAQNAFCCAARTGIGAKKLEFLWRAHTQTELQQLLSMTLAEKNFPKWFLAQQGQQTSTVKKRAPPSRSSENPVAVLNAKDRFGRTPLHWAVINGHGDLVSALLAFGADGTAKDDEGETALQMAERRALCAAGDARGGMGPPSVWGGIAKLLGGSGSTKNLEKKGVKK